MLESVLANNFSNYLRNKGHKVFHEVKYNHGYIDIVSVDELGIIHGYEVKISQNLKILVQANNTKKFVDYSYIVIPRKANSRTNSMFIEICNKFGIGVITIGANITNIVYPSQNKKEKELKLFDKQSESIPGSNNTKKYTEFNHYVDNLIKYTKLFNGEKFKDVVSKFGHHYSNNNSALTQTKKLIKNGVIKGLKIEEGKIYIC
jgi:hypothetical protein